MKKIVFVTGIVTVLSFLMVLSCRKDPCSGMYCQNGGYCSGGACICPSGYTGVHCESLENTTVTIQNDAYTTISLTLNGQSTTVDAGSSVSFTAQPGTVISGQATTSGGTTTAPLGITLSWSLNNYSFPSYGTTVIPIDVSSDYFFLTVKNISSKSVTKVDVNYNLTAQTTDYVNIPNDGYVYGVGYYEAYTNSNLKLTLSDNSYLTWASLNLPFNSNQVFPAVVQ
jgi:hypothetical protein